MRVRDLWVRDLCRTDYCRIYYCPTALNISDFFTKIISGRPFRTAVAALTGSTDVLHIAPQSFLADLD